MTAGLATGPGCVSNPVFQISGDHVRAESVPAQDAALREIHRALTPVMSTPYAARMTTDRSRVLVVSGTQKTRRRSACRRTAPDARAARFLSTSRVARSRHAGTTCGAWIRSTSHIWCCSQLVPRAIRVRGGKREPGVNPGLPRSGKRERPPSSSTGPTGPGSDGQ